MRLSRLAICAQAPSIGQVIFPQRIKSKEKTYHERVKTGKPRPYRSL